MFRAFREKVENTLSTWQWWVLGAICFTAFRKTMDWLEGLYLDTNFPASVIEGQTTFSAEAVKHFYAVMEEKGTIDLYIQVQQLDFILMLTMFAAIFTLTMAAYRSVANVKYLGSFTWFLAIVTPLAPVFDALENIVSFFMLANPQGFHSSLALFHSSFAVTKFTLSFTGIFGAFIIAIIAIIINSWAFISNKLKKESLA